MNLGDFSNYLGMSVYSLYFMIVLISIWCLIWKGAALWKSAYNDDKIWFIVLLIINTFGILEILYIFVFSKREYKQLKTDAEKIKEVKK